MIGHQTFSCRKIKKKLKLNQTKDCHLTHFSFISNTCPPVLLKSTQLGSSVNYVKDQIVTNKKHKLHFLGLLGYLDIKNPKTRWMDIVEHREALVSDQIPVGNLWWHKWQKRTRNDGWSLAHIKEGQRITHQSFSMATKQFGTVTTDIQRRDSSVVTNCKDEPSTV